MGQEGPPPAPSLHQIVTPHPTLDVIRVDLQQTLGRLAELQWEMAGRGGRLMQNEIDYVMSVVEDLKVAGKWKGPMARLESMAPGKLLGQTRGCVREYAREVITDSQTIFRVKAIDQGGLPPPAPETEPPVVMRPTAPRKVDAPPTPAEPPKEDQEVDEPKQNRASKKTQIFYGRWKTASERAGESEHADSILRNAGVLCVEAGLVPGDLPGRQLPVYSSAMVTQFHEDQWERLTCYGYWRDTRGWRCPVPLADVANFLHLTRALQPGDVKRIWVDPTCWLRQPGTNGPLLDPTITRDEAKTILRVFTTAHEEIFGAQDWEPIGPSAIDLGGGTGGF